MTRFSERIGVRPLKAVLQISSMDDDLRSSLWNALEIFYWEAVRWSTGINSGWWLSKNEKHEALCRHLWLDFFKEPLDSLSNDWVEVRQKLRIWFFGAQWHEVYDLVEFVAHRYPDDTRNAQFMIYCQKILAREMSAFRFVDGLLTPVVDEVEIAEVEKALETKLTPARSHLKRALELLSDRQTPDYRNSIKESISAVEAVARVITGREKATLGDALKVMERTHIAMNQAFVKLYGYTSDESGIRHALLEDGVVGLPEAKFMLIACSAFVNYLAEQMPDRETR